MIQGILPYIPAIAQGVKSGVEYFNRPKRKPFTATEQGKYLQKMINEGILPPMVQGKILGQVGATAGNIASQERARIKGGLLPTMGTSISTQKLLSEPGREQMRTVSGTQKGLLFENLRSKQAAEESFAREKTAWDEQKTLEEGTAKQQLYSGLLGAGTTAAQTGMNEYYLKQAEKDPKLKPYVQAARAGVRLPYGGIREEETIMDKIEAMKKTLDIFRKENKSKLPKLNFTNRKIFEKYGEDIFKLPF